MLGRQHETTFLNMLFKNITDDETGGENFKMKMDKNI